MKTTIPILMIPVILFVMTCIPREDPVETHTLHHLVDLPDTLGENSGMTEAGDYIWFINDGGNAPALYGYLSEQDSIVKTVVVKDAVNTDWEDITRNGNNIFIGDFGNNSGDRKDLRIDIIPENALLAADDTVQVSGVITFSYSDQTDFTPAPENTAYDCEAFIATEDSLFLFTKDWKTHRTGIYSLSVKPGNQVARFRTEWEVSGLITAAVYSPERQELYLLGYTPLDPFIRIYSGFSPDGLSYTSVEHTEFNDWRGTQTEGLMLSSNGSLYVSSENSVVNHAGLYRIELAH